MEATIVKLGPSDKLVGVVSFEEAFGQHSELRGRGRARRQKRRMKRISDRGERKRAKQAIRNEQQQSRQGRFDVRKTRKVARKAMGDQEDGEEDPNSVDQQDYAQEQPTYENQGYAEQPTSEGPEYAEESYEETEEEGPEPYDFETGEYGADGEESSEARGRRSGGGGSRRAARQEKRQTRRAERKAPPVQEEVAQTECEEVESLDGDFMDGENLSAATGGKPVQKINPQIRDTTKRIVWNKEALRRHKGNHARYSQEYKTKMQMPAYRAKPNHPHVQSLREAIQRHEMEIQKHEERLGALERILNEKFAGHPHVEHGFKLANIELQKQIEGTRNSQAKATINDTLVDKSLGAQIETNRIDVPAQPEMRTIELSSNASGDAGKGMSTPTKLLIGVAAVGLVYYFAKKYKVI